MAHRIRACATTLVALGLGLVGTSVATRPAWPLVMGEPLWWAGTLLGAGLLVSGALMAFLARGRDDHGEGMLGSVLLRTDQLSLMAAAVGVGTVGAGLLLEAVGFLEPDAPYMGLHAEDWSIFAGATIVALFFALMGLTAFVFSLGRGSPAKKEAAARHHALAVMAAFAPWLLRAFFGR